MVKKKSSYLQRKHKDDANKNAIIWTGIAFVIVVVLMSVLLILNK